MIVHSTAARNSMKYMVCIAESKGGESKRGEEESNACIALSPCERDCTVLQRDTTPLRSFLLFSGTETALYLNLNRKDIEFGSSQVENLGSSSLVHFQSKPYILFPYILFPHIQAGLYIMIFPPS